MSMLPKLGSFGQWRAALMTQKGIAFKRSGGTAAAAAQVIAGTGAPVDGTTLVDGNLGVYLRENASSRDAAVYVTANGGTAWEPLSVGGTSFTNIALDAPSALTIAVGAVTVAASDVKIDTEGAAASDDLDTVNGLVANQLYVIRPTSGTRTVVLRHAIGNIYLRGAANVALAESTDFALGIADATGASLIILATSTLASPPITDASSFYATDTIDAAFQALGTALGGTSSTVRNWTGGTGTRLTDDESFYTSVNKLDQGFVDLLAVTNAKGASLVGIEDVGTFYAGATAEAAFAEIDAAIGGANSTTRNYSSNGYVADNDDITVAVGKLDAGIVAVNARIVNRVDPMAVYGAWGVDVDAADTNGGGFVGAETVLTNGSASQCKVDNGGVIGNLGAGPLAGYTSNWQLFPDVPADNDAIYFASTTSAAGFCEMALDMGGVQQISIGNWATWEYWNGAAWAALTIAYDNSNAAVHTGARPFERDGAITFVPPADWAQATVDAITTYWIRCRVSTVGNIGAALGVSNAKEHDIVTPAAGYLARQTGTIQTIRASAGEAALGNTADTKFILMNYTTGLSSGELTWTKTTRTGAWSGLTLATANGDELGVLVTQEDGAAEHSNVLLELGYVVT